MPQFQKDPNHLYPPQMPVRTELPFHRQQLINNFGQGTQPQVIRRDLPPVIVTESMYTARPVTQTDVKN